MKPIIILFLLAELLDIATTLVNLRLPGVYEFNAFMGGMPIWMWITVKLCVTAIICALMCRIKFKRAWLILLVASLPPLWNMGLWVYVR